MNWQEQLQHAQIQRAALEEQLRQAQLQEQAARQNEGVPPSTSSETIKAQLEIKDAHIKAFEMQLGIEQRSQTAAERGAEPTRAELEAGRQSEKFQQELPGRQLDASMELMKDSAKAVADVEANKQMGVMEIQAQTIATMQAPSQPHQELDCMPMQTMEVNAAIGLVAAAHLADKASDALATKVLAPTARELTERAGQLVPPGQAEFARTQIEQQIAQDLEQGQHDERAEATAQLEAKQTAEREQLSQNLQQAEALQTKNLQDRPELLDRFYEQAAEMKRELELRHAQEQEALQRELEARQAAEREAVSQQLQQIEQQHFR